MIIRQETPEDVERISEITISAFKDHPYSNQTEQFIIKTLRAADVLSISLVAEADGITVGHIAFSPVSFSDGSENWYGLGPVSVLPDYQKRGIGKALVTEGLNLLKEQQGAGCVLVGDLNYYERFGFKSPDGLRHEGVPQENFLALSFDGKFPKGVVQFHKAFTATE